MMHKVLDTNILLSDANNLIQLGLDDSIIVLPETVLDEIDSKKSGHSEIAYQARQFGRLLAKATEVDTLKSATATTNRLSLEGVTIWVAALTEYPTYTSIDSSIYADRMIIEVARYIDEIHEDVLFISNDVMCRLRATSLGLKTSELRQVESTDIDFTKTLSIPTEIFPVLHNKPIQEVDPDYLPQYYNYKFVDQVSGQVKLATLSNGFIQILGKDTEKELRRQDINPLNAEQLFLSKAIQDTTIDIVVCEASAGTGKTLISLSNALRLVKQGAYESITYIRASIDDVDKVEEIGFLAGNEEKLEVYLHPIEDSLDFIVRAKLKQSKLKGGELELKVAEEIASLKSKTNLTSMIGLGMRGRTFSNTLAIIDEAQGMSKASLQKVLTRFGKGSKVIVIGSNNQIDNPYETKYTNGLSVLLDACTRTSDSVKLYGISLSKIVRSDIAEFAENLFTEKD